MLTEEIRQAIVATIGETLPEAFVVSIRLAKGRKSVLDIKVDTDSGISMAECATISREVGHMLEERTDFDFSYTLEVSSPGIGTPLVLHRQYVKNIGRHLHVIKTDGKAHTGILREVVEDSITVELIPDNKRKGKAKVKDVKEDPNKKVSFDEIKEAKVIVML